MSKEALSAVSFEDPLSATTTDRVEGPIFGLEATTEQETFTEEPLDDDPPPYEEVLNSIVMGEAQDISADKGEPSLRGSGYYGSPLSLFEITVTDPVKQGEGVSAHISYRVTTSTKASGYRSERSEVIRRFRDFTWLQQRLRSENRGVIVPALPERNVVEKYKLNVDFIESRRAALQVFINRVAAHPILKDSNDLKLFLEASETEFAIESSRTLSTMTSPPVAAGKKTVAGAMSLFKSLSAGASSLVNKAAVRTVEDDEEDPEYLRLRSYIYELENHLAEVHKQAGRLVRHQAEMGNAISDFGASMAALGRCEDDDVSEAFTRLSERANGVSSACNTTALEMSKSFEAPLKEFTRAVKAAKKVVADRSDALESYQRARADVDSKRSRLAKLRGTPGIQEIKVVEAERDLSEGQRRAEEARNTYESIVKRMGPELARFQKERAQEMTYVLRDFVLREGRLASESARLWRSLVPALAAVEQ